MRILVGDDVAGGAQLAAIARLAQAPGKREAPSVLEGREGDLDQADPCEEGRDFVSVGVVGNRQREFARKIIPIRRLQRLDRQRPQSVRQYVFAETGVGHDDTHGHSPAPAVAGRTSFPFSKWMPHSVLSEPRQRPARASSPAFTGLVQDAQPMER